MNSFNKLTHTILLYNSLILSIALSKSAIIFLSFFECYTEIDSPLISNFGSSKFCYPPNFYKSNPPSMVAITVCLNLSLSFWINF